MKLSEYLSLWKDLVTLISLKETYPDLIVFLLLFLVFKYFLKVLKNMFKSWYNLINYKKNKNKNVEERRKKLFNKHGVII